MTRTMLLLVGEQPAPNLLPARHLEPEAVVLVHSDRTERVAQNLRALLEPSISCSLCQVDPYDVLAIQSAVQELMSARPDGTEWLFNLTGGTKAMALAALFVAQERRYPFVYFQTEGNQSRLLHYRFAPDGVRLETVEDVPEIVSLDEYLRAYVGPYESGAPRDAFETEVAAALRTESRIDEMLTSVRPRRFGNLEIDVAVRCGNHVGIGEVKQNAKKSGVDQLAAASIQAFLGTYVAKYLISDRRIQSDTKNLAEAYRIDVIELLSFGTDGKLSPRDQQTLRETVVRHLARRS